MMEINYFGLAGLFLVIEGVFSIASDPRPDNIIHLGRAVRIGIGVGLMVT